MVRILELSKLFLSYNFVRITYVAPVSIEMIFPSLKRMNERTASESDLVEFGVLQIAMVSKK